ncbi:hypothetical protein [Amphritea pacifica]|uniref:hypothetical protein n=1 Tax=Amphritea pacifica TaxID=2811233 RepID=UPI00196338A7|nr:hypothetical protein [Amphritea pacifica]MBN1008737.1 hypothetical protein [Amphritea pacifica]
MFELLFYLGFFLAALLAVVTVSVVPTSWTLQAVIVGGFLFLGPIIYFTGVNQISWVFYLATALLIFRLSFVAGRNKNLSLGISRPPGFVLLIGFFLFSTAFFSIMVQPKFGELLVSSRWYFFVWPVMLVFMASESSHYTIERVWKLLMLVSLLQLPMSLFQYFVVARISTRSSPWDAVVGTFPGHMDGGGQSAAMAVFLLIIVLLSFALQREKYIKRKYLAAQAICCLITIGLAEVKAAVLLMPVVAVLFYQREIFRRPIQGILLTLGAIGLVVVLFQAYEALHYSSEETARFSKYNVHKTTLERVMDALDPENEAEYLGQIGRVTHLIVWWREHIESNDVLGMLFGHGIGSTEVTNFSLGEIAATYPFAMDVTSTTILLWETGLFGHMIFVVILFYASLLSSRLSRNISIPEWHRIVLRVGAVALLLLIITLPYKNFALRSFPISLLMMLLLGQTAYWWRMVRLAPQAIK